MLKLNIYSVDGNYTIEYETDEEKGSITTRRPRAMVMELLKENGIEGKRGPEKGSKRNSNRESSPHTIPF